LIFSIFFFVAIGNKYDKIMFAKNKKAGRKPDFDPPKKRR